MLFKKWGRGLGRQVKINIPCKKDHWFRELSQRRGKGRQCEVERGKTEKEIRVTSACSLPLFFLHSLEM